jgi:hypothetical protein
MVDDGGRGSKKTPKFSTPMERDGHRQLTSLKRFGSDQHVVSKGKESRQDIDFNFAA